MVDSSGNYNGTYPESGVTYGVTGPITGVGNTDKAITVTAAVLPPKLVCPQGILQEL